jgi:hypothetical protein
MVQRRKDIALLNESGILHVEYDQWLDWQQLGRAARNLGTKSLEASYGVYVAKVHFIELFAGCA